MSRWILASLLLADRGVTIQSEPVRKVDFKEAPEMREVAAEVRRVGNEMYPAVLAILSDGKSRLPEQFDVVFKKEIPSDIPARTSGKTVYLNARYFALIKWMQTNTDLLDRDPKLVENILVHEMAHVTQRYRRSKAPVFWAEGIADYVRYKLDGTNGPTCPQCSFQYPHYSSGYWCLGAFLLHLDATYGSNVVRDLNSELRRGRYTDGYFGQAVGKSLGELWAEFQDTPAFTPVAAEIPFSRTFHTQKNSDPSMLYHYLVVRRSADDPWKIEKAWRTGPDARVIEEFEVQSNSSE